MNTERGTSGTVVVSLYVEVQKGTIEDFLTTCFEGGRSQWIVGVRRSDDQPAARGIRRNAEWVAEGGGLMVREDEDDGKTPKLLDAKRMAVGIVKAAAHRKRSVEDFTEDYDGDDADLALQLALFGEVKYG